jgi:hypothetical protein
MNKTIIGILVSVGLLCAQTVSAVTTSDSDKHHKAKTSSSWLHKEHKTKGHKEDKGTKETSSEKKEVKKHHHKHHHKPRHHRHHHHHHHHHHYYHKHHGHPHHKHHYYGSNKGQEYGQLESEARSRMTRKTSGAMPMHTRKMHMQEMENYID